MTTAQTLSPLGPSPHTADPVRLTGIHKHFGQVHAVRGLDLTIRPGEVVAFLGPNGAGKTTTVDMILGLTRPSSGTVEVFGTAPRDAIARGWVSAVMQTGGLLPELTVGETVQLTASLYPRPRPVDEVLRRAGILDITDRPVRKCSGGQQQRLRFAMALLPDPSLILLDEPTAGMDVEGRRGFWVAIRSDADAGRTVVFATHYLEEADAYADRIVLVRRGQIVADGTAAEVKAMAAGRTLRATVPGADAALLQSIPHADAVELRGETLVVHSADTDAVARHLLTRTDARDLEIASRGLEDAFIALTTDHTEGQAR
ncbi:ABC transporter ATP-binding protein [Prescottella agglutinans]|uniref:ABC transporter ATP-binding protein n=1 Tax=Prescottella agglutinans TaxID=1644129 RepID=A0A3S3ALG1_9NOCA|nr:ABC transporter ATP-binding protein [Prescottella agglutinans]RVW07544.1 ABC transporter ATP-binding protein [Prescottella agglutinans]